MLPLEKAFASPRTSPTPPELSAPGSAAGAQQEEPGNVSERTPAEKTPTEKIPAEKTTPSEFPSEKTPSEFPSEKTPSEFPTEKTPAEKTPAEKTPAEKTPAEKTPTERTPADLEFSRLRFREFVYQESAGPHQTLARLHELCRQWLMPEARSKEQMLELLVLEQFLGILPDRVRPWVVAQYPESCKKAASLVEGLADMLDEPGMLLGSPAGSSVMSEGIYDRYPEPLLFPFGPVSPSQDLGIGDPLCPAVTPWLSMEPLLPELGSIGEIKTEEADPSKAEQKKLKPFLEEPLQQEGWGHLDPAQENLKSYRKLLLSGYQLSQPDTTFRLDTEELQLEREESEPAAGKLPGGGRQQEGIGSVSEDISTPEMQTEGPEGDCPAKPSGTTEKEKEQQPCNVPDPQDRESSPVSESQGDSIIQNPAPDKGKVKLAAPHQGLGMKRPHPEDEEGQGPEPEGASREPNVAGQDPSTSASGCPAADKPSTPRGKPYACSECGEAFAWISHLMEHHSSHGGRKRFACQGCWKTFHFSLALAEHQKTHEKEKGYTLGVAPSPQSAVREAQADGRAGEPPESAEGEVCPGPPEEAEAQR